MADIAASVLAKLRNKEKASGISYQQCLVLCQEKVPVKMRNMHSYTQLPVHCIDFFL